MATTKRKPSTTKKSAVKKGSKAIAHRSLVSSDRATPFMTFRFTQQTLYWIIIGALILALAIWVLSLTIKVQSIYDDIDELRTADSAKVTPNKH